MPPTSSLRDQLPTALRPKRAWRIASRFWKVSPFPTRVRLRWVLQGTAGDTYESQSALVHQCQRRTPGGEIVYRIGGKALHVTPHFDVPEEELCRAIEIVLRESYLKYDLETEQVKIQPGDVVVDLGANIGSNTLLLSDRVGSSGHVYAFEPIMHRPLSKNLETNGASNVTLIAAAVSDEPGEMTMVVRGNCIDSHLRRPGAAEEAGKDAKRLEPGAEGEVDFREDHFDREHEQELSVPVTTLDAFVAEHKPERLDFVKVDIEGAEEQAIRGATETIKRFKPKWSISSYHIDRDGDRQHDKLVKLLREFDYNIHEVGKQRIYAW